MVAVAVSFKRSADHIPNADTRLSRYEDGRAKNRFGSPFLFKGKSKISYFALIITLTYNTSWWSKHSCPDRLSQIWETILRLESVRKRRERNRTSIPSLLPKVESGIERNAPPLGGCAGECATTSPSVSPLLLDHL
jgi:hypothetical protein